MQQIAEIARKIKPGVGYHVQPDAKPRTVKPVSIKDIDTSHHPLVKQAVQAAYEWVERKKSHPNASLVLVASQLMTNNPDYPHKSDSQYIPDINRTGYGVGKTHIARSIMWSRKVVDDDGQIVGHCGKFYLARDLVDRLRQETPQELAPKDTRLYAGDNYTVGTHAVVIDDIGTEGVLPYVSKESQELEMQARYFEFINYCYGGFDEFGNKTGVSLVITANMTLDQLAAHLGGRCWSRLLEMAPKGFMVDMTGVPDWRRRQSGRG